MSVLMKNDEMLAALVPSEETVSVTADGVKTASALLNELSAVLDRTKIDGDSYFIFQRPTYRVFCKCTFRHLTNGSVRFGMFGPADDGKFAGYCFIVSSTSKAFTYTNSITPVEISSEVIDSGDKFIVCY